MLGKSFHKKVPRFFSSANDYLEKLCTEIDEGQLPLGAIDKHLSVRAGEASVTRKEN